MTFWPWSFLQAPSSTNPRYTSLTRRALLSGIIALSLVACKGDRKKPPSPPPPPPAAGYPIGYSHVLKMSGDNARAVAAAGGRLLMAEPFYDSWGATALVHIRAAADVMRPIGGNIIVVAVNANEPGATTQAQVQARVKRLRAEVGEANVWLEPVSEPWVERLDPARAEGWARAAGWTGRMVRTVHPCSMAKAVEQISPARIVVTDCTPVLASRLSKEDNVKLVRIAKERRATFLLYDTFPAVPWNPTVVQWLREGLQG